MHENTCLSRQMVEFEVSRYITWPGQATACKIGMVRIMELRQRAEDRLGERFDLVKFHNVLLGSSSVPLEKLVDAYIESEM